MADTTSNSSSSNKRPPPTPQRGDSLKPRAVESPPTSRKNVPAAPPRSPDTTKRFDVKKDDEMQSMDSHFHSNLVPKGGEDQRVTDEDEFEKLVQEKGLAGALGFEEISVSSPNPVNPPVPQPKPAGDAPEEQHVSHVAELRKRLSSDLSHLKPMGAPPVKPSPRPHEPEGQPVPPKREAAPPPVPRKDPPPPAARPRLPTETKESVSARPQRPTEEPSHDVTVPITTKSASVEQDRLHTEELEKIKTAAKKREEDLQNVVSSMEEAWRHEKQLKEAIIEDLSSHHAKIEHLESHKASLEKEKAHLQTEVSRLQVTVDETSKRSLEQHSVLHGTIDELRKSLEHAASREKAAGSQSEELRVLAEENTKHKAEAKKFSDENGHLKAEISSLKKELGTLKDEIEKEKVEATTLKASLHQVREEAERHKAQVLVLSSSSGSTADELAHLKAQIETLNKENTSLKHSLDETRNKNMALDSDVAKLKVDLAAAKNELAVSLETTKNLKEDLAKSQASAPPPPVTTRPSRPSLSGPPALDTQEERPAPRRDSESSNEENKKKAPPPVQPKVAPRPTPRPGGDVPAPSPRTADFLNSSTSSPPTQTSDDSVVMRRATVSSRLEGILAGGPARRRPVSMALPMSPSESSTDELVPTSRPPLAIPEIQEEPLKETLDTKEPAPSDEKEKEKEKHGGEASETQTAPLPDKKEDDFGIERNALLDVSALRDRAASASRAMTKRRPPTRRSTVGNKGSVEDDDAKEGKDGAESPVPSGPQSTPSAPLPITTEEKNKPEETVPPKPETPLGSSSPSVPHRPPIAAPRRELTLPSSDHVGESSSDDVTSPHPASRTANPFGAPDTTTPTPTPAPAPPVVHPRPPANPFSRGVSEPPPSSPDTHANPFASEDSTDSEEGKKKKSLFGNLLNMKLGQPPRKGSSS